MACALIADRIAPGAAAWFAAGHRSTEPAQSLALAKLGLEPLLDLGLRLGEGSGAVAAVPRAAQRGGAAARRRAPRRPRRLTAVLPDAVRLAVGTLTAIPVPAAGPRRPYGRAPGDARSRRWRCCRWGRSSRPSGSPGTDLTLPPAVVAVLAIGALAAGSRAFHLTASPTPPTG